ncbi:MAG: hypothetical protein JO108_16635 [Acidobacteriaceae bacterium]|nr:hypothetical protein [Acidobacteriaceae bacterium]
MRAYLITTGALFGILALLHVWRIVEENRALGMEPWFVLITVICGALSLWAFRLLSRLPRA